MEKFNDDFFIGCEDISADFEEHRRHNREDDYPRQKGGYPRSRSRDTQHKNVRRSGGMNRDPRRTGSTDDPTFGRGHNRKRDNEPYRQDQRRNDPRYHEQRSVHQKRKRSPRISKGAFITISLVLILAIVAGIVTIAVVSSGVGSVESLTSSGITSDQVVLSWEKVDNADGYRIMTAKDDAGYEEYQTILDPDTLTATVAGLDQASLYNFSVIALKKEKESSPTELKGICTLPETPVITSIYSAEPGTIHVDWTINAAAAGYIVEVKKDTEDYSDDLSQTISDPEQHGADVAELEVDAAYTVRVYSYIDFDGMTKSAPSEEQSVTVTAESVAITPKAMDQQVDSSIDPDKPMIALTFDDGPAVNGDSGERILDVLEQNGAKATFFMVGYYASQNPDNVKRKAALKMELGNHTWDHTHYGSAVTPDDIRRASNQIYEITGQFSTCFRSPGGETTAAILSECASENMAAYYWSIDTQDWSSRNADAVYHSVMDNVKDGDIILMHEIYDSTADAVERMVPELIAQGYQLVTCHDLITLKGGSEPVAGTQYVNAFTQSEI